MAADNEKLSKSDIEVLKKRLLKEKAPSTRRRTAQIIDWDDINNTIGQPFKFTDIPLSKLDEMRRDPTLSFAMHYARVPILRASWDIEGDDAQINAFIKNALAEIYASFVLNYLTSWDYGYQAIVKRFKKANPNWTYIDPTDEEQKEKKVWDNGNIEAIVWDTFVSLPPQSVEPHWNRKGEFAGIIYDGYPTNNQFPFVDNADDGVKIPLENSLWITNEKESRFGSIWGFPRLGYAYQFWWTFWFRWALADRAFEKSIDPGIIVRFPAELDSVGPDGEDIDPRELAFYIGEQMRSNDTVAMPSSLVPSDRIDGGNTNMYEWSIEQLESKANFEALNGTFESLKIDMISAVWTPPNAILSSGGAQSSRNVTSDMTNSLKESQAVTMAEIDEHINRYMIPQLIEVNFPDRKGVTCKKVTTGFSSNDEELTRTLIQLVGQADPNELNLDIKKTLEMASIPTLTPQQIQKKEEDALQKQIQQALIAQPPQPEVSAEEGGSQKPAASEGEQAKKPSKGTPGKDSGKSSVKYSKMSKNVKDIGFEEVYLFEDDGSGEYIAYVEDDKILLSDQLSEEEQIEYAKILVREINEDTEDK